MRTVVTLLIVGAVAYFGGADASKKQILPEQYVEGRSQHAYSEYPAAASHRCQCKPGPPGPPGKPGYDGRDGLPGFKGKQGYPGDHGAHGLNGLKGEKGDDGNKGPRGHRGSKGDSGEKGERGDTGVRGPPGQTGAPGFPGAPGHVGPKGKPGPEGPPGSPGRLIPTRPYYPSQQQFSYRSQGRQGGQLTPSAHSARRGNTKDDQDENEDEDEDDDASDEDVAPESNVARTRLPVSFDGEEQSKQAIRVHSAVDQYSQDVKPTDDGRGSSTQFDRGYRDVSEKNPFQGYMDSYYPLLPYDS